MLPCDQAEIQNPFPPSPCSFTPTLVGKGQGFLARSPSAVRSHHPVLVHRLSSLLHASFRPRLAASVISPLRFAMTSPPSHARHTKKAGALGLRLLIGAASNLLLLRWRCLPGRCFCRGWFLPAADQRQRILCVERELADRLLAGRAESHVHAAVLTQRDDIEILRFAAHQSQTIAYSDLAIGEPRCLENRK
jgi:hypothetical protein